MTVDIARQNRMFASLLSLSDASDINFDAMDERTVRAMKDARAKREREAPADKVDTRVSGTVILDPTPQGNTNGGLQARGHNVKPKAKRASTQRGPVDKFGVTPDAEKFHRPTNVQYRDALVTAAENVIRTDATEFDIRGLMFSVFGTEFDWKFLCLELRSIDDRRCQIASDAIRHIYAGRSIGVAERVKRSRKARKAENITENTVCAGKYAGQRRFTFG